MLAVFIMTRTAAAPVLARWITGAERFRQEHAGNGHHQVMYSNELWCWKQSKCNTASFCTSICQERFRFPRYSNIEKGFSLNPFSSPFSPLSHLLSYLRSHLRSLFPLPIVPVRITLGAWSALQRCFMWGTSENHVTPPVYTLYTSLLPYIYLYAPFIHVYTPYIHL